MWRVCGHADGQGYGARLEGSNRAPRGLRPPCVRRRPPFPPPACNRERPRCPRPTARRRRAQARSAESGRSGTRRTRMPLFRSPLPAKGRRTPVAAPVRGSGDTGVNRWTEGFGRPSGIHPATPRTHSLESLPDVVPPVVLELRALPCATNFSNRPRGRRTEDGHSGRRRPRIGSCRPQVAAAPVCSPGEGRHRKAEK